MLRVVTAPATRPLALDPTATTTRLGSSDEAIIEQMIAEVTDAAERIAGRMLWYREYEERKHGGGDRLYLSVRPIAAVSSLTYYDDSVDEGADDDEFIVFPAHLWSPNGFAGCDGSYAWVATYTAGYWLPSMGATPASGAVELADGRPDLEGAIFDAVKHRHSSESVDSTVKRFEVRDAMIEYAAGATMPKSSYDTFRALRPVLP